MAKTIGGQIRDMESLLPETPSNVVMVNVKDITIKDRLREANADRVEDIARSIQIGTLLQPITITKDHRLISGLHRLKAYQLLKRKEIPCQILDVDEIQARLLEIDENLIRKELSVLELGEFLLEKEKILSELHMRKRPDYQKYKEEGAKFAHVPMGITKEIAQNIGMSQRSVQLKMQIARNIDSDVRYDIKGSVIENNQSWLEKISKLALKDQKNLVNEVVIRNKNFDEIYKQLLKTKKEADIKHQYYQEEDNLFSDEDEVDPELYEGYPDISEKNYYFPMKSQKKQIFEEEDEFEFTDARRKQEEPVYEPDFEIVRISKNAYNKAMMYANTRQETIEQLIEGLIAEIE